MPLLSLDRVSKRFDGVTAVDQVSFAVDRGQVVGFLGPNGALSKGYRQRVGLAQAILHRPDLLVLDEPTEGLDPNQRVEIRQLIGTLGRDRTVLLSTHVLSEVQQSCSRLLIISRGKIVADGPVDRLIERASGAVEIAVEAAGDGIAQALHGLPGA